MVIALKKWIEDTKDDEWAKQVLAQNRVQDDVLDETDFALRYGQTAAKDSWGEIESALQAKDKSAYETALQNINTLSNETITTKFMNRFAPLAKQLEKLGVSSENIGVPQSYDGQLRDSNKLTRKAVSALLASALLDVYEKEFGNKISEDVFTYALDYPLMEFGNKKISLEEMIRSSLKTYGEHFAEEASGITEYSQINISAPEQFNEFHQSAGIDTIEKTFGIDVRIVGSEFSDGDIQILHQVLSEIQKKRPKDFEILKTLHFQENNNRLGGYAGSKSQDDIHLSGAFAAPNGTLSMPDHYALESQTSGRIDSTRDYLFKLLAHELAHLVAIRDGKKRDGFDVPASYEALTPNQEHKPHEWFAEDYSLFLISSGQRVADITVGGQEIPNYDSRLEYFKRHYPLASHS